MRSVDRLAVSPATDSIDPVRTGQERRLPLQAPVLAIAIALGMLLGWNVPTIAQWTAQLTAASAGDPAAH